MLYVHFKKKDRPNGEPELIASATVQGIKSVAFEEGDDNVLALLRRPGPLPVIMSYPRQGMIVHFNHRENNMRQLLELARIQSATAKPKTDQQRVFVFPGTAVPEDGVLNYKPVTTLRDIAAVTSGVRDGSWDQSTVLMLDVAEAVLEFLLQHPEHFDFQPVILTGVPKGDYTAKFDQLSYGVPFAGYAELIESVASEQRVDAAVSAVARDDRRARRVEPRTDGPARTFSKFEVRNFEPHPASRQATPAVKPAAKPAAVEFDEDVGGLD